MELRLKNPFLDGRCVQEIGITNKDSMVTIVVVSLEFSKVEGNFSKPIL